MCLVQVPRILSFVPPASRASRAERSTVMPRSRLLLVAAAGLGLVSGCEPGVDNVSEPVQGSGAVEVSLDSWCHYRVMLDANPAEGGLPDSVGYSSPKRDSAKARAWEAAQGATFDIEAGKSSRARVIDRGAEGSPYPILSRDGAYFHLGPIGNGEDSAIVRYSLPTTDQSVEFILRVSVDPVSVCVPW